MEDEAARLAGQVKLAYEFIEELHRNAAALLADVMGQLADADEPLQLVMPGGSHRFTVGSLSLAIERFRPYVANSFALYFRDAAGHEKHNTPFGPGARPVAFCLVVLRGVDLAQPEVRYGRISEMQRARPDDEWSASFEKIATWVADHALTGRSWAGKGPVDFRHEDNALAFRVRGWRVPLVEVRSSEDVATKVVEPLLKRFREAEVQAQA